MNPPPWTFLQPLDHACSGGLLHDGSLIPVDRLVRLSRW